MISTRQTVITLATLGLGLIFACSSSSSGTSSSSSSSSSGGSSSGGSSSGGSSSGGSSSGGSSSGGFKQCASPTQSSCSQADLDTYNNCVLAACDADYKECYGSNYKSGDFSGGSCSSLIACESKCACNDTACSAACLKGPDGGIAIDPTCSACSQKLGTCVSGTTCTVPACMKTGSSSGTSGTSGSSGSSGQTCATLQACCDKITDATFKSACQSAHDSASGNDATCNTLYPSFKSYCP
jgi:hypothetical protein